MKSHSLRLRLIAGGAAAVALALTIAGMGLAHLFERHVTRAVADDLEVHIQQLLSGIEIGANGHLKVTRPPVDPRFADPLSGLYWQAGAEGQQPVRSRSLWDTTLKLANNRIAPGAIHLYELKGPSNSRLLTAERDIVMSISGQQTPVRVAVAIDLDKVAKARAEFSSDLALSLALLGAILAAAMWIQIGLGLRPLEALRDSIADINSGKNNRIDATVPAEVQPIVDELNGLLKSQEHEIRRARDRAADLAHGLKTPLAALAADARRLRKKNENSIADGIEVIGESMRRHVERELTRARVRSRSPAMVAADLSVLSILESVVVMLSRTPDGERVGFDLLIEPAQTIAMDRDDLAEILGNLLENASRHARTTVRVSCIDDNGVAQITVEDDGAGISSQLRSKMIERGNRLDESDSGDGLGLAIVQDILDAYGRQLELGRSDLGGLRSSF